MALPKSYYLKKVIESQVIALEKYLTENLDNIKSKQDELDKDLKEALEGAEDEEHHRHLVDSFLDFNLIYYDEFPKFYNDSTFLILYSFFEANLARIARLTRYDLNARRPNLITTDPINNYSWGSKAFLTGPCGLKLKAKENVWKKINQLKNYRNFIAHNNSNLKQTPTSRDRQTAKKAINYINRVFGKCISIDHLEQCHIEDPKILVSFFKLVKEYLLFVSDKAVTKCKSIT